MEDQLSLPGDSDVSAEDHADRSILDDDVSPVLHLLVVGFHHKKGCQVEYSFPPLDSGLNSESHECPELWKNLPSLAMPDGSHNFIEDTVYFHLPSLTEVGKTVYGVSSYRQIEARMLSKRTADITRSTVQKSVCLLSNLPLYGHVQVKMGLITEAYFREGDFTQYSLLQDAYRNLNMCLSRELLNSTQALIGLPLRELVQRFQHKVVVLFKLVLLQKRVLFFHSPVRPLCTTILALLALVPGLVENGLDTCTELSSKINREIPATNELNPSFPHSESNSSLSAKFSSWKGRLSGNWSQQVQSGVDVTDRDDKPSESQEEGLEDLDVISSQEKNVQEKEAQEKNDNEIEQGKSGRVSPSIVAGLPNEECGMPLQLFGEGYLCHPYLSLSYLDMLADQHVRGYLIGATNVLFKQKKALFDVVIELESGRIDVFDTDLRRQLELTKEDMRFADHLVRHVVQEKPNVFLDGVGWEGGDEWIRAEFKSYLLLMLRTSLVEEGCRDWEEFNPYFMQALEATHCYNLWLRSTYPAIMDLLPGHLFSGQLSMSDVKLKLSQLTQTMQNTEKGRKISSAAASTGRVVAQTGRAVGGVLSQAKGALSQWWNTFHTPETPPAEDVFDHEGGVRMSEIDLHSN